MITVTERVDPVVQALFRKANEQGLLGKELAARSGVGYDAFWKWRRGHSPRLVNLVAALEAVGLRLKVEEVER